MYKLTIFEHGNTFVFRYTSRSEVNARIIEYLNDSNSPYGIKITVTVE